jgi:hypothetical protein
MWRRVVALAVALTLGGCSAAAPPSEPPPSEPPATQPAVTVSPGPVPRPDHVVIVVFENKNGPSVAGNSAAPYLNSLAAQGASFANSFGLTHPSQPNYLGLFSGSTQGVTGDACPKNFTGTPNLGSQLIAAGLTFAGYSEGMPADGFKGCGVGGYARKHNPWVDFDNVPATSNLRFSRFPGDFSQLPTVSFVIPNLCHDMHDCAVSTGDTWLRDNLGAFAEWAKSHNSLLIVTFDEDDFTSVNRITTVFFGQTVRPGVYQQRIDHYTVLRTLEDMYGLAPLGNAAAASPLTDIWTVGPGR